MQALRIPATLLLVLPRLAGLKLSWRNVLLLWNFDVGVKDGKSVCQVVVPAKWWGMGLHRLLKGYKNGSIPYFSLNLLLGLHCLLEWWPGLPLISEGCLGQTSFWPWYLSVAIHYNPDGARTMCSSMLSPKGLSRNFKDMLTAVSSYLGGTVVAKRLDPVPKLWGLFWRYCFFFFVLKFLVADEAVSLGPFLE